jgi:hypothetical protein
VEGRSLPFGNNFAERNDKSGIVEFCPLNPPIWATVYTHLSLDIKILHFAPLAPPILGGTGTSKSPKIGGFRGQERLSTNQRTCVYTVANFGGRIHSKSPRIGGFRGHSRIYARDTMSCAHNARMKRVLTPDEFTELTPDIIRLKIEYPSISPIA